MRRPSLAACSIAAAATACALLFAWGVRRHVFLTDDMYISLRYARNFAEGRGLVWNPGERVEGYTDFLWVVLLAAAMRLHIEPELATHVLGIASGAALLACVAVRALRRHGAREPLAWSAPLLLAAGRSCTAWCTGGLETMPFALLVFTGLWSFGAERRRATSRARDSVAGAGASAASEDRPRLFLSSILLASAALLRPEGALFAATCAAIFLVDVVARRRSVRAALAWTLPWSMLIGAHFGWRRLYYGAWVPNTFHAKVGGAWWSQGFTYLRLFAEDYYVRAIASLPFLLLAVLALTRVTSSSRGTVARSRAWGGENAVLFSALAIFVAWVAYAGGDRFEFRFLVYVLPLYYALVGDGLVRLAHVGRLGNATRLAAVALALASILAAFRTHFLAMGKEGDTPRAGVVSIDHIRKYCNRRVEEGRFLRQLVDERLLGEDLVLAVGGAGAVPYFTCWPTVDRLGLCDATIASMPLAQRGVVAHEHDAPAEYLASRRVAIFDAMNRLVYPKGAADVVPRSIVHDGQRVKVHILRAKDRELVFGTFLSDGEFRARFRKLEIVR